MALLPILAFAAPAQNAWYQVPTTNAPTSGLWPGMAYALGTTKTYLYGGGGGSFMNETWEYDGVNWTQLTPATNPGDRDTFGMCYDVARGVVVLFGGKDGGTNPIGQTWEYDPVANTWANVSPVAVPTPAPRWGCRMVYDVARSVCVLYGGYNWSGFTNDTWEWNGAAWTLVATANRPSGRDRFGLAYDIGRNRTVLFGGIAATESDETWEYDGVDWTLINTPTRPPARQKVYLAYDPTRGRSLMQGGQAAGLQLTDCWEYDGVNWRRIGSTPAPARGENGTVFDVGRGVTVVFGGWNGRTFRDTWEYGPVSTPVYSTFGVGCPGSAGTPSMAPVFASVPALGSTFSLDLRNLPASGGLGLMILGFQNYRFGPLWVPLDLGLFGLTGCTAYAVPGVNQAFVHSGGTHTWSLGIPNLPQLQGITFYNQAMSLDPLAANGVLALSNAGEGVLN